jgi:DNA-binding IscR family transcriptional regulator
MALSKSAEEMTILEVVQAVEPIQRIRTCPLGLAAHGVHLCPLHSRMDAALATVEEALGSSTLAEVLAEPTKSIPLCPFPVMKQKSRAKEKS